MIHPKIDKYVINGAFEMRIKELSAIPEELPMEKYYGDNRTDIDLEP